MFLISPCSCPCPVHWNQVLSQEWRCCWSSAAILFQPHLSDQQLYCLLLPVKLQLILEFWWYMTMKNITIETTRSVSRKLLIWIRITKTLAFLKSCFINHNTRMNSRAKTSTCNRNYKGVFLKIWRPGWYGWNSANIMKWILTIFFFIQTSTMFVPNSPADNKHGWTWV